MVAGGGLSEMLYMERERPLVWGFQINRHQEHKSRSRVLRLVGSPNLGKLHYRVAWSEWSALSPG